jgi:hypothetical protein
MKPVSFLVRPCLIATACAVFAGCAHASVRLTTVTSAAPRAAYERGMLMLWGFDYPAAVQYFEEALKADPSWAMPAIGIALALGPNVNDPAMQDRMPRAFDMASRARTLAEDEPEIVRALADALLHRYTAAAAFDLPSLNKAYAACMTELAQRYPKNDDIAVLYAESLMLADRPSTGHVHARMNARAITAVENVLRRNSHHIGANHFHIHLLEGVDPRRALPSARRLDRLRPEASHLVHMPSHITARLGDYAAAVASNVRAFENDLAVEARTGTLPSLAYHTREYLAYVAGMTGQAELAKRADDNIYTQLRFNRWADVLTRPRPSSDLARVDWRIGQVLAFAAQGKLPEAVSARREFEILAESLPAATIWWSDPLDRFIAMVRPAMDATVAWARGDRAEAVSRGGAALPPKIC